MPSKETGNIETPTAPALAPIDKDQPPAAKSYEVSTERATLNAVEKIWVIGPWLVVIYRIWHWQGLVLFLFGLIGGALSVSLLLWFGLVPNWVLPEKYRPQKEAVTVHNEQPITPHGDLPLVEVPDVNEWNRWLEDYKMRFRVETNRFDLAQNPRRSVLKLRAAFSSATTQFDWRLGVDPSHRIVFVRGFRVTNTGLIYTLDSDNGESTATFKSPACERGDILVAVVATVSRTASADNEPVFQSSAP